MASSQEITRKAKSNLAFALGILPKDKRRDVTSFYAFCRTIDDLADDEGIPMESRRESLANWKRGLEHGFEQADELQAEIVELRDRCEIPTELLVAIIEGCEMDLEVLRYESRQELDDYIWKVACAVGLVCIRLFGCKEPESETYALALGRALQLTNILRDLGEDWAERQRIYLPQDELKRFNYSQEDLATATHDERFLKLMEFQAKRAQDFYREAEANLTPGDRHALRPARIMAAVYQTLLERMRRDGFRVFEKRYRIGKFGKLFIALRELVAG